MLLRKDKVWKIVSHSPLTFEQSLNDNDLVDKHTLTFINHISIPRHTVWPFNTIRF